MVCKQLVDATKAFVALKPIPSMQDIARAVCRACVDINCCPMITMEQAEPLIQLQGSEGTSSGAMQASCTD